MRRYNTYRAALELLECLGHIELSSENPDTVRLWALRQVLGACRDEVDETLEMKLTESETASLAARQTWGLSKAGGRYPWPQLLGLELGGNRVARVDVEKRPVAAALLRTMGVVGGVGAPEGARAFAQALGRRDITPSSLVLTGHTHRVHTACVSPDGAFVVTASDDETARVWSLADGALLRTLEGHTEGVFRACVSADGAFVVTASFDNTARVWSLADGALLRTLEGHTGDLFSACVSPDGVFVVAVSFGRFGKTPGKTARVYRYLARLS